MREILIDGYNLIRQSDRLADQERKGGLQAGREALIQTLGVYRQATGDRVTVFFDGDEGIAFISNSSRQEGIEIIFSSPPESADDLIVAHIRKRHGKKAMLVVSSDRAIQSAAGRHRIAAMPSQDFEAEMSRRISEGRQAAPPGYEKDMSPDPNDVAYWERRFRTENGMFEEGGCSN